MSSSGVTCLGPHFINPALRQADFCHGLLAPCRQQVDLSSTTPTCRSRLVYLDGIQFEHLLVGLQLVRNYLRVYRLLCALVFVSACSGGGSGGYSVEPLRIASAMVSPDSVTLDALDATAQLEAAARDTNGNNMTAVFTWSSSDASIATVDANGLDTAQANGAATITAASGEISASTTVTVEQQVSGVSVSPGTATLTALGDTAQLGAVAHDANGHAMMAAFGWTSSDASVVTVDAGGLVTAQGNGVATITASSGGVVASVTVTVEQRFSGIAVSPGTVTLRALGDTAQLGALAHDANGHAMTAAFSWVSSDTSIATVDANGLVTAQSNGVVTVTASSGGFSGSVTVTVVQIVSVAVSPNSLSFDALGDTAQLEAIARDEDGEPVAVQVRWVTLDSLVATVNSAGRVTSRGNGSATITASAGSVSASVAVTVDQRPYAIDPQPRDNSNWVRFNSIGETIQFSVEVRDSNGHPIPGLAITADAWDKNVAVIDENLLATARRSGSTVLRFFIGDDRDTYSPVNVEVHQIAARMEINPSAWTFQQVNESHRFTADAWDANGHPVPAEYFSWETADPRIAVVDDSGLATINGRGTTEITLRAIRSSVSAAAAVSGELGATCAGGPRTLSIATVEPESLVEGASVVIEGAGFCPVAAGNLVTIDGMVTDVESASETALRVTVPQYCRPAREVELTVKVDGDTATRPMGLRPDETAISLPVGQQVIFAAGAGKCIQFNEADTSESYLIGVQSTLLGVTQKFTPVRLIAAVNPPETQAPVSMASRSHDSSTFPGLDPVAPESNGPEWENLRRLPEDGLLHDSAYDTDAPQLISHPATVGSVPFPNVGDINSLPEVGDIVTLPHSTEEWIVHTVGTHALWLVKRDEAALMEERYPGRIDEFADSFDIAVYPVITDYFGIAKLGNTGRLVVQVRAEPERVFETGAFLRGPPARKWKMIRIGLWLDSWRASRVLAHELTHVLQFPDGLRRYEPWFHEGHAELGTEIFDFTMLGLSNGQNYERRSLPPAPGFWTVNFVFAGLASYLGGNDLRTPQECSWLVIVAEPETCAKHAYHYDVGWSLFRWLTDQYGRLYPGGEQHFHQELIRSEEIGPPVLAIEQALGETTETLLARWAAAIYVDDRVADADPTLQFTSWNLRELHRHHYREDNAHFGLYPVELPFADAQRQARIRDGSIWYLRVSGDQRPATAIGVLDRAYGTLLSDDIQIWAVRLE